MYFLVCVPHSQTQAFAQFVDETLCRNLDWRLVQYEAQFESKTLMSSSRKLVLFQSIDRHHLALQEHVHGFSRRNWPNLTTLDRFSVWVFAPPATGLVEDVRQITEILTGLGCHIGLSSYMPS